MCSFQWCIYFNINHSWVESFPSLIAPPSSLIKWLLIFLSSFRKPFSIISLCIAFIRNAWVYFYSLLQNCFWNKDFFCYISCVLTQKMLFNVVTISLFSVRMIIVHYSQHFVACSDFDIHIFVTFLSFPLLFILKQFYVLTIS